MPEKAVDPLPRFKVGERGVEMRPTPPETALTQAERVGKSVSQDEDGIRSQQTRPPFHHPPGSGNSDWHSLLLPECSHHLRIGRTLRRDEVHHTITTRIRSNVVDRGKEIIHVDPAHPLFPR